jgi:hypothetical protein
VGVFVGVFVGPGVYNFTCVIVAEGVYVCVSVFAGAGVNTVVC